MTEEAIPVEDIQVTLAVPKGFVPTMTISIGLVPGMETPDGSLPVAFAIATNAAAVGQAVAAGASLSRLLITLLRGVTKVFGEMAGKSSESDMSWEIRPE